MANGVIQVLIGSAIQELNVAPWSNHVLTHRLARLSDTNLIAIVVIDHLIDS
jgi:hypothetical protein